MNCKVYRDAFDDEFTTTKENDQEIISNPEDDTTFYSVEYAAKPGIFKTIPFPKDGRKLWLVDTQYLFRFLPSAMPFKYSDKLEDLKQNPLKVISSSRSPYIMLMEKKSKKTRKDGLFVCDLHEEIDEQFVVIDLNKDDRVWNKYKPAKNVSMEEIHHSVVNELTEDYRCMPDSIRPVIEERVWICMEIKRLLSQAQKKYKRNAGLFIAFIESLENNAKDLMMYSRGMSFSCAANIVFQIGKKYVNTNNETKIRELLNLL